MSILWFAKLGLAVTKAVLAQSLAKSFEVMSLSYLTVKLGTATSNSSIALSTILPAFVSFGPIFAWTNESVKVLSICFINNFMALYASSSSFTKGSNKSSKFPK